MPIKNLLHVFKIKVIRYSSQMKGNSIIILCINCALMVCANMLYYTNERVSEQYTSNYDYHSFPFCYSTQKQLGGL